MTCETPQFLYFDLGNVLARFSHDQMCQQMATVAGCSREEIRHALFDTDLIQLLEVGELDQRRFHERLCAAIGKQVELETLTRAGTEIFSISAGMIPVIAQLAAASYRLGILSNTCPAHWDYLAQNYDILTRFFDPIMLSYRVQAMKPDAEIFAAATRAAEVPPHAIFYTDDMPENVAAAQQAGWDAVLFENPTQYVAELRRRGITFNY